MKPNLKVSRIRSLTFTMEYAVFGSGKKSLVILPGVSLHSLMPSAGAVAAAYSAFAEEYTVYLFDRRRDMQTGFTVEEMADDTAAAMKALGISGAYIFGASQGGMTAQLIAAKYPGLVKKAALASCFAAVPPETDRETELLAGLALAGKTAALNRRFRELVYSPEFLEKYAAVFEMTEADATAAELEGFAVQLEACRSFDSRGYIKNIACPVLVTGGGRDRLVPEKSVRELAELTGAELYIYPGGSHAVYDEAPDYKRRLYDFFKTTEE